MVDIYLVANPLALSTLPSRTAMTALHNTLESIYNTHQCSNSPLAVVGAFHFARKSIAWDFRMFVNKTNA
jgi:hypothetical protein